MSGTPAAAVSQALSSGCRLLDIDETTISALKSEYPWYVTYTIPAGTYPNQNQDIRTTAIKMVLFCSASLDEETVYQLTKSVFDHAEDIAKENAKGEELSIENATSGMTVPFHAGAARYYAEHGVNVTTQE